MLNWLRQNKINRLLIRYRGVQAYNLKNPDANWCIREEAEIREELRQLGWTEDVQQSKA
jgi:hypothetical protein